MREWLRGHVTSAAMTGAAALMVVKTILPGIFDFVIDLGVVGLIGLVGHLNKRR